MVEPVRRAGRAAALRLRVLRHRGGAVACPLCRHRFSRFRDDWNRSGAICWRCGSHERHRALWLYLESHPELLGGAGTLLHFAPEWCLRQRLGRVTGLRYVTGDVAPAAAQLQLDITDLALADGSFDAILCSHVLEHVEDDRAAIGELHRVLAPAGWAIVMVPVDVSRKETYEDPSVRTPEQRRRAFWQSDHVRLYAPDIAGRLRAGGFQVQRVRLAHEFGPEQIRRFGLLADDELYVCRKPERVYQ